MNRYSGRIAIFELLPTDSGLRELCIRSASANEMKAYAVSQGISTLRQSGWQRVLAGQTSVDEVLRVCANDDEHSSSARSDEAEQRLALTTPVLSGSDR